MSANTEEILRAIRRHCLSCSGGSREMAEKCRVTGCELYPYRSLTATGRTGKTEMKGQISIFGGEKNREKYAE